MIGPHQLGRLPEFDERSRQYSVAEVVSNQMPTHGKLWSVHGWLDQGNTPSCVGNSRTYDLAAYPQHNDSVLNEAFAQKVYRTAQTLDEWPGTDYEGTSVLAGCKAVIKLGFVGEYRWAFTIEDVCKSLVEIGPVVFGTDWLNSMFNPRPSGLLEVDPSSGVAGGHAYFCRGVAVSHDGKNTWLGGKEPIRDVPLLRVRNSWGRQWGNDGECLIWADDYERYLMPGGDQSVVTSAFKAK